MMLKLEQMTLEQKLGFVMCARPLRPDADVDFVLEMIRKRAVGCVQIPTANADLVKKVRDAADYPILIINDAEQGFPASLRVKTQHMTLAACKDEKTVRAFAKCLVHDAQTAGFNAVWGPVVDVLSCDGPCKVHRTFSDDADVVSRYAQIIFEVMQEHHFLGTGKHYPGQGGMRTDTHIGEDVIETTLEGLEKNDLKPYLHLMDRGLLPAIMTTHSTFAKIDAERPASLSKKVNDLLRARGYDGICFSDSLAMKSILHRYGEENIYGMALAAGNDIVLPNYDSSYRDVLAMLKKNYEEGTFSEQRLDEAVRRVLQAQAFVCKQQGICPITEEDEKLLESVCERCITAVTDEGVSASLPNDGAKRLFVVLTDRDFQPDAQNYEIGTGFWYDAPAIARKIRTEFPDAEVCFYSEYPSNFETNNMMTQAEAYEQVVFITFCTSSAYFATDCLTRRVEHVLNAMIRAGKIAAVVHFGNPLAMERIAHVPRLIFGYMMRDSQQHVIEVLSGKRTASGSLPFRVHLQ